MTSQIAMHRHIWSDICSPPETRIGAHHHQTLETGRRSRGSGTMLTVSVGSCRIPRTTPVQIHAASTSCNVPPPSASYMLNASWRSATSSSLRPCSAMANNYLMLQLLLFGILIGRGLSWEMGRWRWRWFGEDDDVVTPFVWFGALFYNRPVAILAKRAKDFSEWGVAESCT